jgi:hypothetical protein
MSNNPFAQLVSPESLAQAIAGSERLSRLRRRVCRPLDKPLIPLRDGRSAPTGSRELSIELA